MAAVMERVTHVPTTALGAAGAGVNLVLQVLGCEHSLADYKVWLPSAVLLLWGLYLGPTAAKPPVAPAEGAK